jgi:hypothetical protein
LEQLAEKLHDLEEMGPPLDEDDESSDGEDVLGDIMATPSESLDSVSPDVPPEDPDNEAGGDGEHDAAGVAELPQATHASERESRETTPVVRTRVVEARPTSTPTPGDQRSSAASQTLRSRRPGSIHENDTATTTSASLFGNRDQSKFSASQTATTEAILDQQRAEQESLYESLATMASDLKKSSMALSVSLEEDKDVVTRAGDGLSKNEQGLEVASRRMGTLQKMAEGKGWWARMLLYAWIYGLMVVLVLVVFVLPKLRFSTW